MGAIQVKKHIAASQQPAIEEGTMEVASCVLLCLALVLACCWWLVLAAECREAASMMAVSRLLLSAHPLLASLAGWCWFLFVFYLPV